MKALLCLLLLSLPLSVEEVTSLRVNGDSIEIKDAAGKKDKVRPAAVGAPEMKPSGGPEAEAYRTKRITSRTIRLHAVKREKYSRCVARNYRNSIKLFGDVEFQATPAPNNPCGPKSLSLGRLPNY